MRKQISYYEPIPVFDPETHSYIGTNDEFFQVTANSQEELNATLEVLSRRNITDYIISDLPPIVDAEQQMRADIDYLAIMTGVNLYA